MKGSVHEGSRGWGELSFSYRVVAEEPEGNTYSQKDDDDDDNEDNP
jgi:hypothetical protein